MTSGKSIFFAAAAISIALLVFAYFAYPVPAGDSMFFLVPAVQFAKSGALTNPIYPSDPINNTISNIVDPSGMKKFLFYPPLFQLVLSFLMPEASSQGVIIAVALINILVVWFSALLFYKVATRKKELNWLGVSVMILVLVALAASLAETGRPEALARMWIVLGALVPFYISKKYDWIFYGVLLGLMFATHPAGGFFSTLILGLMFGITLPFEKIILKGSAILLIAFFTTLGGITLGPFSIRETIEGTFANAVVEIHGVAQEASKLFTLSNLSNHYIFSQTAPFYGLVIALTLVVGFFFFWKHRSRIVSPFVVVLCVIALAYFVGKIMFTIGHVYYITLFAPIIFSVCFSFFGETKAFGKSVVILIFALIATGFMRTVLLFPLFVKQAQGLSEARAHIANIIQPYENQNVKFGVGGGSGGGSWYFSEDYKNMYSYNLSERPKENTAFIFLQQRYSGRLTPPEISGCVLKDNAFSETVPKIFGVKLGNTMPGYGYAVYNCFNHVKT